eukprot:TRINITY_DN2566_c0_g2_i2.p1 TRINITY_DN2566_c0_g2~~TRINITY_DN2566_c0_g2_i2.p1  ORF type:complete len:379 (-),score=73.91 TRINITY_DN2566_c0_g2_i2:598-1734(-)
MDTETTTTTTATGPACDIEMDTATTTTTTATSTTISTARVATLLRPEQGTTASALLEARPPVADEAAPRRRRATTQVPARLDRLPWCRWHAAVVFALGVTWVLDGIEVSITGNIAAALTTSATGMRLSEAQVGAATGIYIAGACLGSLVFSYLADRYGRRKLFVVTLSTYLLFSVLTAFSWEFYSFATCRFLAGMGIGGEYSAVYSAIDEIVPARVRGQLALLISGTYWVGAAAASLLSALLLNPAVINQLYGWRVAFGLGASLGIGVLLVRGLVPESPRWLMTHGCVEEAERVVSEIEEKVRRYTKMELLPLGTDVAITIELQQKGKAGFVEVARVMFLQYPRRTVLGLVLMSSQAFLYNAIFFTAHTVLPRVLCRG